MLVNATILVWHKNEKGEEVMSSKELKMYESEAQWAAQQYAEVNKGVCNIMTSEKIIGKFDAR